MCEILAIALLATRWCYPHVERPLTLSVRITTVVPSIIILDVAHEDMPTALVQVKPSPRTIYPRSYVPAESSSAGEEESYAHTASSVSEA